jgi:hypothetical protein
MGKINLFDVENETSGIEEFRDKLFDAGICDLEPDQEIKSYGKGMVGIVCVSKVVTNCDGSPLIAKKYLLKFQADHPLEWEVHYLVRDDGAFDDWVSIFYSDSDGNSSPEENPYFDEFLSDLNPVDDEDDDED